MLVFGLLYIRILYGGVVKTESVIEAASFATQTATTIGYGNWVPATMKPDDCRILAMKAASVPFMILSAGLFATIIGIAANWLSRIRQ